MICVAVLDTLSYNAASPCGWQQGGRRREVCLDFLQCLQPSMARCGYQIC